MQDHHKKGFTLVELLVVMAVIVLFMGGLGLALTGGSGTVATQAGQRMLTTMIASARTQAVLNQTSTRLIIHVDEPDSAADPRRERFLRFMAVVKPGPNGWEPINDGNYLPSGVYVVPPVAFDPAHALSINLGTWEDERRTIVERGTMEMNIDDPGNTAGDEHYMFIQFDARGTTEPETVISGDRFERRIVVAPARATPTIPTFEEDADTNALGGVIRRNGSFTLVHNPAGFPEELDP